MNWSKIADGRDRTRIMIALTRDEILVVTDALREKADDWLTDDEPENNAIAALRRLADAIEKSQDVEPTNGQLTTPN